MSVQSYNCFYSLDLSLLQNKMILQSSSLKGFVGLTEYIQTKINSMLIKFLKSQV